MDTNIRICQHCSLPYDWRRSASASLKMTYCGSLCEKGDLGFTIEALLTAERQPAFKLLNLRQTLEPVAAA